LHVATIDIVKIGSLVFRLEQFSGDTSGGFWYAVYENGLQARPSQAFCHGARGDNLIKATTHMGKRIRQAIIEFRISLYTDDAIVPEWLDY